MADDQAVIMTGDSFPADGTRHDPYRNMNFLILIDGFISAGFKEADGLNWTVEEVAYREGGDNSGERKSPGRTTWEPIILRRGMTVSTEMYDWATASVRLDGAGAAAENLRRNINIILRNKVLLEVKRWAVYNCWVSKYVIPTLDAMGNDVLLEELTVAHEGWELVAVEGVDYVAPAYA